MAQNGEFAVSIVHPVCCGVDIHKEVIVACLTYQDKQGKRKEEVQRFRVIFFSLY